MCLFNVSKFNAAAEKILVRNAAFFVLGSLGKLGLTTQLVRKNPLFMAAQRILSAALQGGSLIALILTRSLPNYSEHASCVIMYIVIPIQVQCRFYSI